MKKIFNSAGYLTLFSIFFGLIAIITVILKQINAVTLVSTCMATFLLCLAITKIKNI